MPRFMPTPRHRRATAGMVIASLMLTTCPLAALAQAVPPASVDRQFDATTLNLSAYGETKIAPDEATIALFGPGVAHIAKAKAIAGSSQARRSAFMTYM